MGFVSGFADPAFDELRDAMVDNLRAEGDDPGDLGAALTVYVGGRKVADLVSGWTSDSRDTAWTPDTLVNAYSTMKPVAAVLALRVVAEGLMGLDDPIASCWPEFAAHGKETITLRQALCHTAGLAAVGPVLHVPDLYRWDTMTAALASTPPWWPPGTAPGYHTNTFGFLIGEPVSRLTGLDFSTAVRRLSDAFELDMHCGLGVSELPRVADVDVAHASLPIDLDSAYPISDERSVLLRHAYANPPNISGVGVLNSQEWRMCCVPSTNGHTTARGLARFYSTLLPGAHRCPLPTELLAEARTEASAGTDVILERPIRFGLGFQLHMDDRPIGLTDSAFGHFGYGGSLGFADPGADVAFGYLTNRPGKRWQNVRVRRLVNTLASALGTG